MCLSFYLCLPLHVCTVAEDTTWHRVRRMLLLNSFFWFSTNFSLFSIFSILKGIFISWIPSKLQQNRKQISLIAVYNINLLRSLVASQQLCYCYAFIYSILVFLWIFSSNVSLIKRNVYYNHLLLSNNLVHFFLWKPLYCTLHSIYITHL